MSAENRPLRVDKVLSLLGVARRAGVLLIGQDQVFRSCGRGEGLFLIASEDCSPNVLRKALALDGKKTVCRALRGIGREELGRYVGVRSAQIAAIPIESGFAKKIALLLRQEGSGIDE
ncbi:MAG: ribosomal L7Ae/L30e/S12e/Gadd45 family protein [Synergistaceae bacterium]|nr:ribosomal L7Ae/L30e/S12e/Gadd45 family protein [Synergistaceae bacterium]